MKRLEVSDYQDLLQIGKKCLLLSPKKKKKKEKRARKDFTAWSFLLLPSCPHLPFTCFHTHSLLHFTFHFPIILSILNIFTIFFCKLLLSISHLCTALDHLSLPWNMDSPPLVCLSGSECRARKMSNVIKMRAST